MANTKSVKRKVSKEVFKGTIKTHGVSLKDIYSSGIVTERSLNRCFKEKTMSCEMVYSICSFLELSATELFGPDDRDKWREFLDVIE